MEKRSFEIILSENPPISFLNILNDIYKPILGTDACNCYIFYLSQKHVFYDETELLEELHISFDALYLVNRKLNALNLISEYTNGEKHILIIKSMLSPFNFFSSVALKTLFFAATNESYANKIIEKYDLKLNFEGYKKVVVNLYDVFSFDIEQTKGKEGNSIDIFKLVEKIPTNLTFSIAKCYSFLKKYDKRILLEDFSNKDLKEIIDFANVYSINENNFAKIIFESLKQDKKENDDYIDYIKLKKNINLYLKYNEKAPKKAKTDETFDFKVANKNEELINYYLKTKPFDLLKDRTKGINPTRNEIECIEFLQNKYSFSNGVINALIDFMLNKYKFLNTQYVENFAAYLKRNDVNDVFKALDLLYGKKYSLQENKKSEVNNKNNKTGNVKNDKIDYISDGDIDLEDFSDFD